MLATGPAAADILRMGIVRSDSEDDRTEEE
jgi:hypothetical protein